MEAGKSLPFLPASVWPWRPSLRPWGYLLALLPSGRTCPCQFFFLGGGEGVGGWGWVGAGHSSLEGFPTGLLSGGNHSTPQGAGTPVQAALLGNPC